MSDWTIRGSGGEPIIGTTHRPTGKARGVALVAHGFKGYKDYGMFPALTSAVAGAGLVAHRFNFSHSGMTERIETFERPDLFERDTWNRQVEDLQQLVEAIGDGTLDGDGLPLYLIGHSRGGVAVLLAAGRAARDGASRRPSGIVTLAAPSTCSAMPEAARSQLLADGFIESPSSRTGQTLRVGAAFLQEQLDDPEGHALLDLAARIESPVLVVHGADDPTVPAAAAKEIGAAIGDRATVHVVAGGDHVFNTPNPFAIDDQPSPQLAEMIEVVTGWLATPDRAVC